MRFVFMPYEFVDVPFTESYWENLGCEWWYDKYLL